MERRKFSREFKLVAVNLVKERGVSIAQAARDVGNAISATLLTASTDLQAAIDALKEIRLPNGEQEGDFAEAA